MHRDLPAPRRSALALLALALLAGLGGCRPAEEAPTEWVFPVWEPVGDVRQLGFINQAGRRVVEPLYAGSLEPTDGIVPVAVEVDRGEDEPGEIKWGFLDFTGAWLIEPRFDRVGPFADQRAPFVDGDILRAGYLDPGGTVVIEAAFEAARRFSEGLAAVRRAGAWGYIDTQGAWVIEPRFHFCRDFAEGLAAVETEPGKAGYVDREGQMVIPAHFAEGYSFSEGLAAVRVEDGTWGFIDQQGVWVIEPRFFGADLFSEGLAPVRQGLRWGYVDRQGRVVIEPGLSHAGKFSLGLAPVEVPGEGWGFIDAEGKLAIEPRFQGAEPFVHSLAAVQLSPELWGYVDTAGNLVWAP